MVFKGYLEFDKDIGYNVNNLTGKVTPINRIKAHFSKKGYHSVPAERDD